MSKAGIQSNRGDGYQTLVAFDWALTVLSDPEYQWIEVDSVAWAVDDVVIGKVDGTKICCQCKKNQKAFKAWSVSDLADELGKAISLLQKDDQTLVRFYSRNDFGELSALREYSTNYADAASYKINLGTAHRQTEAKLALLFADQGLEVSTYELLQRTEFVVTDDLERMKTLLHERLRQLVSNPIAAYMALWTRLDHLGMRMAGDGSSATAQHRLTKSDLGDILTQAGAMLSPPVDLMEVRASFESTSAIGRTWHRHIGNQSLPIPLVNEVLNAIDAKCRSILITGLPGTGKTCLMLALQDELERIAETQPNLLPVFIQSREFADFVTTQDRAAQGLSEQWVERVARMAETAQVVVVIDSLDVLSIAREHSVLTYFLAQIDRLLLVENVIVVTACRDFDRHYDRRIAHRSWSKEFRCEPLAWETEIAPLLGQLGIDASDVDAATRDLVRNPRELAIYVELAQKGGSFNVVTSQALAQRYLAVTVQSDSTLGETAMQAIEAIASAMLKSRSLAVPPQRFAAPKEILHSLLSHNVLHETQDKQLTFGHQTLLDVLVISDAVRRGVTLNAFIQSLPPVPFVRPSIRSLVAQLAAGDRREFRKQLRTVLTGVHAFHIRRLIAETLAEQIPQDDDWPLIRDLRSHHRDVFQVIYTQADRVEWHTFWLKHLVPALKHLRDVEGLRTHVHRTAQWKKEDPRGVLAFWAEVLALDWIENESLAGHLEFALSGIDATHSASVAPLLQELLNLPRREHNLIGRILAACVEGGSIEDSALWRYIVDEVTDEDVLGHRFGNKLHCQPHEFGDKNFLADRMQKSTALLDLAITDLERWGRTRESRYSERPARYCNGFLHKTSYSDDHQQTSIRHIDNERILLDAVQKGIVQLANSGSEWWYHNRQRLCFNSEGSLRYFAIIACTSAPTDNLEVIGQMLSDKALLDSDLSYEFGTLMQTAFLRLDEGTQDAIQAVILTVGQETPTEPKRCIWMLHKQAQLILTIPRHVRSPAAQTVIDQCEEITWPLVRRPRIGMRGGVVSPPFSFEVFLDLSNAAVLQLLAHYNGYLRDSFSDFLIGGEREVGSELGEAASRQPTRFVSLLLTNWNKISDQFRDDIMDGAATYLERCYGNLQKNASWTPLEKPDPTVLARQILDELEIHAAYWHHKRVVSRAIKGCANVIVEAPDAARLTLLAIEFSTLVEESSISGESVDLLTKGINMARGNAAETLMILANNLEQKRAAWPDALAPALRLFAVDSDQAIRALLLRRMAYLQSHKLDLGWELFERAMTEHAEGLWAIAEPCLYYAYHQRYDIVAPWLTHLYREGSGKDLEVWGRISALVALSKQMTLPNLIAKLRTLNSVEAWQGAASVWTHSENAQKHREQCLAGLEAGLNAENLHATAVARKFRNFFRETSPLIAIPLQLLRRCLALLATETDSARIDIFGFDEWLNVSSILDPITTLEALEIYLEFVRGTKTYLYDHENNFTQLLTRLFAQAEEQEELDGGGMLQRVVIVQDTLLALGVSGVDDWLKVAERS